MSLGRYRLTKSKEAYFAKWNPKELSHISASDKEKIYQRYLLKCEVFQRDGFKCQNADCEYKAPITLHHIKWQKNNGQDKPKNCVTVCKTCHKRFHSGKAGLQIGYNYYEVHKEHNDEIDWKKVKAENRQIRKNNKHQWGLDIPFGLFMMLWKFLEVDFSRVSE